MDQILSRSFNVAPGLPVWLPILTREWSSMDAGTGGVLDPDNVVPKVDTSVLNLDLTCGSFLTVHWFPSSES